jgi:hypothetical protein
MGKRRREEIVYDDEHSWHNFGEIPSIDQSAFAHTAQKVLLDQNTPNFDNAVKQSKIVSADIPIKEISFYSTQDAFIASGGFAELFKAYSRDGKTYALKLFFNREKNISNITRRNQQIESILQNVESHKDVFKEEPFLAPRIVSGANWYLMEYLAGTTMQERMDLNLLDNSTRTQAIQTYMDMLFLVHKKDMIVGDNNWGSLIIGENTIKICDYDLIMPATHQTPLLNKMQNDIYHNSAWKTLRPITARDDLESFAYMMLAAYDIPVNNRLLLQGPVLNAFMDRKVPKGLQHIIEELTQGEAMVSTDEVANAVYKHA